MNSCPWLRSPFAGSEKRQLASSTTLGEVSAAGGSASNAAFIRVVRQKLSRTLCQCNTCMYDLSLVSVAYSVGRDFIPELERAIDEDGDVKCRTF